ncbi:hypothetical protein [uncultured Methylobacterium sp.]|uniref:hypothetical protein n=1 Tax=uncultured Methylobacterium sp. TaxID=157278 RepID=UPI0035C99006
MDSIHDRMSADGNATEAARLERSVAAALNLIAAAQDERTAPPVQAARRNLAAVYGLKRLRQHQERVQQRAQMSA